MSKHYGLRLDLGGAPNTPHWVPGVPGTFRPEDPSPIGEDGEGVFSQIDVAEARRISNDDTIPLKLVELKPHEVKKLSEQASADVNANRQGAAQAAQTADGAEPQLAADAVAASQEG
jgi:hypothetical protein